jgi:hypothetical protein
MGRAVPVLIRYPGGYKMLNVTAQIALSARHAWAYGGKKYAIRRHRPRWQPPMYCRLSRALRRELLLALTEGRRLPSSQRDWSMFWRHTYPGLWRRTGHRPWWLLHLRQRGCVGGRFRGSEKCRPAWLVMLTAPRWARMFDRRLARHQQMPLIPPAATKPFPQPWQQPRRKQLELAI